MSHFKGDILFVCMELTWNVTQFMLLVIFHRKYWMKCQLFHLSTSITRVDHTNLSHQKLPITFSLVTRYKHKMSKTLTLFDCKSALMACKMPPTPQKFCDFSYFYMTYLKSKKLVLILQWFGCLERVGIKLKVQSSCK